MNMSTIVDVLKEKNAVLVTAESLTGGLIAERITAIPGASSVLWGGFVVYTIEAKIKMLKVHPEAIRKYGVVSIETAEAMAEGALKTLPITDKKNYALAVTGIAGPSGGTAVLPIGTVCIACARVVQTTAVCKSEKYLFKGSREAIREQTYIAALKMLQYCLDKEENNGL